MSCQGPLYARKRAKDAGHGQRVHHSRSLALAPEDSSANEDGEVPGGGGLATGHERHQLADASGPRRQVLDERETRGMAQGLEDSGLCHRPGPVCWGAHRFIAIMLYNEYPIKPNLVRGTPPEGIV